MRTCLAGSVGVAGFTGVGAYAVALSDVDLATFGNLTGAADIGMAVICCEFC